MLLLLSEEIGGERKKRVYLYFFLDWQNGTKTKKEWGKGSLWQCVWETWRWNGMQPLAAHLTSCSRFLCISKCRFPLNMHNLDITFRFSLFFSTTSTHDPLPMTTLSTPLGYATLLHLVNLLSPVLIHTQACVLSCCCCTMVICCHIPFMDPLEFTKGVFVFATQWMPSHMSNRFKLCKHPRQPVTPLPTANNWSQRVKMLAAFYYCGLGADV